VHDSTLGRLFKQFISILHFTFLSPLSFYPCHPIMPKHTRSSSGSQNRSSAYGIPVTVTPASMYAAQAQPRMTVPQAGYYTMGPSSATAMPLAPQSHHAAAAAVSFDVYTDTTSTTALMPSATPTQHRPSSGAWSPHDDQQLITARMQGLNWAQIKDTYFPSKTGNACRKRHERLMDRKGTDDWDARRSQQLALDYMSIRKEIWSPLAVRTGEKWQVVEQKVSNYHPSRVFPLLTEAACLLVFGSRLQESSELGPRGRSPRPSRG
jgi:hypothetical protein